MSFNYPQAQNALLLQGNTVASTTPTAGQVLVWNGGQWQPGAGIADSYHYVLRWGSNPTRYWIQSGSF